MDSKDLVAVISQMITDRIHHSFTIMASFICLTESCYFFVYSKNLMINPWPGIKDCQNLPNTSKLILLAYDNRNNMSVH